MGNVAINERDLTQIRNLLQAAIDRINLALADVGCLHLNAIDMTTMGGGNKKIALCPDCGETIESEIDYGNMGL